MDLILQQAGHAKVCVPLCSISQVFNVYQPLSRSGLGVFQQLTGISGIAGIGDQIVAVVHHVTIGPDDCQPFGDLFGNKWVKGTVKAFGRLSGPFPRMIGSEID